MDKPEGCGNHSCWIAPPKGQRTNGPCCCDIRKFRAMVLYQKEVISKLRAALVGLVGASSKEELEAMEVTMRSMPIPDADKAVAINAIHALISIDE